MGKEPREIPGDEDNNPFLCMGSLLQGDPKPHVNKAVPTDVLTLAITQCGIYDCYGPSEVRLAGDEGERESLRAILLQYEYEQDQPERKWDQSPVDRWVSIFPDVGDIAFARYGWAKEVVPDVLVPYLDNVRRDPGTQQIWEKIIKPKIAIKREIAKWDATPLPAASDRAIKEKKLALLQNQVAELDSGHTATLMSVDNGEDLDVFKRMPNLNPAELSLTFVGDKKEEGVGANGMLEISARGRTKRIPLAVFGLVDRRSGNLDSQGLILLGFARGAKLIRSDKNAAKMTRLREVISTNLGVEVDPFEAYRKGAGWVPLFSIKDKLGAADERATREAERNMVSFDALSAEKQFDQDSHLYAGSNGEPADDPADAWLKKNDPEGAA